MLHWSIGFVALEYRVAGLEYRVCWIGVLSWNRYFVFYLAIALFRVFWKRINVVRERFSVIIFSYLGDLQIYAPLSVAESKDAIVKQLSLDLLAHLKKRKL